MPILTLFHCMSARSFRPLWALEELGLPYTLKMLPFPPRVHAREFMKVNALGTIPALVHGDITMTESVAICHFLATGNGPSHLAISPGHPQYGPFLNWLHFGEATLTFPQTIILRYGRFEPVERRLPQAAEDYRKWFLARLRAIDTVVNSKSYLCGEDFTVADISVGYALMLASYLDLTENFPAGALAYWERLQAREGYQRALAVQLRTAREQGVPEIPAPLAY